METTGHLEVACAAATRAAEATAAKSAGAAASGISTVIPGRCRCTASSVPAIVRSDDARNAAFKIHVGGFHAFIGHGHIDVRIVLDVERLFGMHAVIIRLDGHFATGKRDGSTAVETVIAAADFDNATAHDDARIALDTLHAGIGGAGVSLTKSHTAAKASTATAASALTKAILSAAGRNLDGRSVFFAIGNSDSVVRRNTVKCSSDGDFATRDFNRAFAFFQISGIVGIALDAIATGRRDVDSSARNADRALALHAVILRGHRNQAVFDSQVVRRMDTVVVVPFDDESAFALEGEVILGIDTSACRIGLGLASIIRIRVRFGSRRSVSKRIGRAIFRDDKRLVRLLDVNRGVSRVGERQSLHVQINSRVRLW